MITHITITLMIINMNNNYKLSKKTLSYYLSFFLITSCTLVPGMQEPKPDFFGGNNVYFGEKDTFIPVIDLDSSSVKKMNNEFSYFISPGDILNFVVWGLEDIFPMTGLGPGLSNPQTARTVNSDGSIFFPYAGLVYVEGLTIDETRNLITEKLSREFVNPQIDITVTEFNESRKAYLLGEVLTPQSIIIGIEKISLTDAIGSSRGLDPRFSDANHIYIIREEDFGPVIYKIDLSTPEKFLLANEVFLRPKDIIYASSSAVTKWNRFFSQIFPFASFFNQIDNIGND
tara:strand:+ start:1330 stop:2190 length:861 start_codon:yes stop_codon:yes gene_type:complete